MLQSPVAVYSTDIQEQINAIVSGTNVDSARALAYDIAGMRALSTRGRTYQIPSLTSNRFSINNCTLIGLRYEAQQT
jgi:hypothetical protein